MRDAKRLKVTPEGSTTISLDLATLGLAALLREMQSQLG
jgi:hypothetical protein